MLEPFPDSLFEGDPCALGPEARTSRPNPSPGLRDRPSGFAASQLAVLILRDVLDSTRRGGRHAGLYRRIRQQRAQRARASIERQRPSADREHLRRWFGLRESMVAEICQRVGVRRS